MSTLDFSNFHLPNENSINFLQNEILSNNSLLFQVELNILKSKFNKLQNSIIDIINKKSFNFKNFLTNKMNIKLHQNTNNNPKENNLIKFNHSNNNNENLSYSSLKRNTTEKEDLDDIEIINEPDTNNIIIENNEKEYSNYINSDKNINNYIIPSFHSISQNENINSICNENELTEGANDNKSFSSTNNIFIVQTENNLTNNRKMIGKKRNNGNKNKNQPKNLGKKEELLKHILDLYNQRVKKTDNFGNSFKIIQNEKKDVQTIIIEDKKIWDISINKNKIKQIYSYQNATFYTKNKDIVEQLNIIQKYFEDKCINFELNINNDI